MLFDVNAALAEIENQAPTPATSATFATQSQKAPCHVANVADVAAPWPENGKSVGKAQDAHPESEYLSGKSMPVVMDRFYEKAAMLEYDEGLSRDTATWLAALGVFVLPDERGKWFGPDDNLLPGYRQVNIAVDAQTFVTFHDNRRVSFCGDYAVVQRQNDGAI